jgi:regulator of extracellular matrix RemA (YlzA/DUF370 family)
LTAIVSPAREELTFGRGKEAVILPTSNGYYLFSIECLNKIRDAFIILVSDSKLAIIIPPASISLKLVRARKDGMIIGATYCSHKLPVE